MKSGIYCIENLINGKKYIGQSSNLNTRKSYHFNYLKNNKHDNSYLQNAYNKHGNENFIFKILLICEEFELTKYEKFFVDYFGKENIYNICLDCVNSRVGVLASEETKRKMKENHADFSGKNHPLFGSKLSEKTKKLISLNHADFSGKNHPLFGTKMSEETKKKISESHKGKRLSEEQKKKLRGRIPWNKGIGKKYEPKIKKERKPVSEESKSLMRLNHPDFSGKNNPMYGKHLSKESIEKRNETRKRNKQIQK